MFEIVRKKGQKEMIEFNKIDPSAREILTLSGIVSTTSVGAGLLNFGDEVIS